MSTTVQSSNFNLKEPVVYAAIAGIASGIISELAIRALEHAGALSFPMNKEFFSFAVIGGTTAIGTYFSQNTAAKNTSLNTVDKRTSCDPSMKTGAEPEKHSSILPSEKVPNSEAPLTEISNKVGIFSVPIEEVLGSEKSETETLNEVGKSGEKYFKTHYWKDENDKVQCKENPWEDRTGTIRVWGSEAPEGERTSSGKYPTPEDPIRGARRDATSEDPQPSSVWTCLQKGCSSAFNFVKWVFWAPFAWICSFFSSNQEKTL